MKPLVLVGLTLLLLTPSVWARPTAPAFEPEEFVVDLAPQAGWSVSTPESLEPIDTVTQYDDSAHGYQVRYSFFKEARDDIADAKTEFQIYIFNLVQKLAGRGGNIKSGTDLKESDVQGTWGGSMAKRFLIAGSPTDYSQGFQFLQVTFYWKQGQGIVCQAILFHEEGLLGSAALEAAARSFRFSR